MTSRDRPLNAGRLLATLMVAAFALVACGNNSSSGGGTTTKYVVGVSNTLQGNGWREEMICSIKAQAKVSGIVSKVVIANRNTDAAGQISDIRNLISSGANVIVINPSDRDALNTVIKEATAKGIVVVAVDQAVSEPSAYVVSNDQVAYGNLGATWLAKQLGGKGNIIEMRGINGVPADTDRHQGLMAALAQYPGIHVVKETFTGWSLDPAAQQMKDIFSSGIKFDGIWTSGIDSTVVDSFQSAGKSYVPIVGADNNKFVQELATLNSKGLVGAAVTNPPPIGGAGLAVGLAILTKSHTYDHVIHLTPQVWDNTTAAGVSKLAATYDSSLDPYYSVAYDVKPYTTYTKQDLISCAGPS
ncbi:MAG TPA: ABC transporter substrate-binding protein [Candidatus Dormibacteraeota bacterium]|nr:ABC transporter substrate-binding protein [Candidatus Dormibacteraeota bacterium]HEX2681886.1 ABC transporter substrate-binding protein [Candidatus Dormibacteraeota bacterium]